MELERLAVGVRPRSGWESLDLGFQMAREWWRTTWSVWLVLFLPVAAVALSVFENRFYSVALLWWLKPLFDRAILFSLSRQVFGEHGGIRATLRHARDWLGPGLFLALTVRRFETARSFFLPVTGLEKQTGKAAHQRRTVLGSRMRGTGIWLTVVCMHIEAVSMLAIFSLGSFLSPGAMQTGSGDGPFNLETFVEWNLVEALCYVASVSLIEPFYVAAGFSLYLSRRTILEAWDMEIQLRRLGKRLRETATSVVAIILCCVVAFGTTSERVDAAQNDSTIPVTEKLDSQTPKQVIQQILADPEFEQYKEVKRWRSLEKKKEEERSELNPFWRNLGLLFADISQGLLWVGIAILIPILLYVLRNFIPEARLRKSDDYVPPTNLFGLDVAPGTLPDNIPEAATILMRNGKVREALSLLYRGALSGLIHHHRVTVNAGATESDCLRAAANALSASDAEYFAGLVAAWKQLAYGGALPDNVLIVTLCRDWPAHFRSRIEEGNLST